MDLSKIASIAGKGGLFRIMKPTRTGVIVEPLNDQKKKLVIGANYRVSVLQEVSIYTTDGEGSIPLEEVFAKIQQEFGDDLGVDTSDAEELKAFLKHVVPNYDTERVYTSDMKKLVNWYNILSQHAPEVLSSDATTVEATETESEVSAADTIPEDQPKESQTVPTTDNVEEEQSKDEETPPATDQKE